MVKLPATVTDAPLLPQLLPTGKLLAVIPTDSLPSLNEIIEKIVKYPYGATKLIKSERARGYDTALAWATDNRLTVGYRLRRTGRRKEYYQRLELQEPLTRAPVFVFVRYWRLASLKDAAKGNRTRDVFNLCLKAFVDGFTDAGLWVDDSEEYVTDVWIHYQGTSVVPRIEVLIYERG